MPLKAIAHFVYRYQRKCCLERLDGINEIIFEMLFWSGNQNPSSMFKLIIGIIHLLLIQSKPGQNFLVGFRNRALVITEQVLANVGLILSKGLCLLNAHRNSMKAGLKVN